jgi:hypothetical protein
MVGRRGTHSARDWLRAGGLPLHIPRQLSGTLFAMQHPVLFRPPENQQPVVKLKLVLHDDFPIWTMHHNDDDDDDNDDDDDDGDDDDNNNDDDDLLLMLVSWVKHLTSLHQTKIPRYLQGKQNCLADHDDDVNDDDDSFMSFCSSFLGQMPDYM